MPRLTTAIWCQPDESLWEGKRQSQCASTLVSIHVLLCLGAPAETALDCRFPVSGLKDRQAHREHGKGLGQISQDRAQLNAPKTLAWGPSWACSRDFSGPARSPRPFRASIPLGAPQCWRSAADAELVRATSLSRVAFPQADVKAETQMAVDMSRPALMEAPGVECLGTIWGTHWDTTSSWR